MVKPGEVYENPVTSERAVIRIGTDTKGELLVVDLYVRPGGAVMGEHFQKRRRATMVCQVATDKGVRLPPAKKFLRRTEKVGWRMGIESTLKRKRKDLQSTAGNQSTCYITLDHDFVTLANLQGIIGDPQFVTRDRMGRDLAFMCHIYLNGWSSASRERT